MRLLREARECVAGVEVGDHPEGRPGVRPAQDPDAEEAVAEFAEYLRKVWRIIGPEFKDVYGKRDESKCLYMNDTVVVTLLATTALKCRSRNAADACRNSEATAASMLYLSGQDWWPERERFTTACTGTLVYRTRNWDFEKVRICEKYGWKYVTTFKEGRTPDLHANVELRFRGGTCESGDLLRAGGKPRTGKMKWVNGIETNAPDRYAINVVWGEISFLDDLTKTGKKRKPYVGMFATNVRIANVDAADEVFCWGRRRWNIENVFKEQKRVEVGLKHRFVNKTDANRVWYCLMMMAWTIWQMFQRGFLLRLEVGCRKMTQLLWCEMIRTYIRYFGCVMLEPRYTLMSRRNL